MIIRATSCQKKRLLLSGDTELNPGPAEIPMAVDSCAHRAPIFFSFTLDRKAIDPSKYYTNKARKYSKRRKLIFLFYPYTCYQ